MISTFETKPANGANFNFLPTVVAIRVLRLLSILAISVFLFVFSCCKVVTLLSIVLILLQSRLSIPPVCPVFFHTPSSAHRYTVAGMVLPTVAHMPTSGLGYLAFRVERLSNKPQLGCLTAFARNTPPTIKSLFTERSPSTVSSLRAVELVTVAAFSHIWSYLFQRCLTPPMVR